MTDSYRMRSSSDRLVSFLRARQFRDARAIALFAIVLTVSLTQRVGAEDEWRQFRGPGARGVSENSNLPEQWSETDNILWSWDDSGRGWSSPIVTAGRIFLTTVTREEGEPEAAKPGLYFGGDRSEPPKVVHDWRIVCLDLETGELLWERSLHKGLPQTPRHIKNSYASETPVTDGQRVYAMFGDVGLYCLTIDGEPVWSMELPPCETRNDWGTAASPVLHGERLYLISDNEDESYLMALDKTNGDIIWRVERDEPSNWSTPYVWENELRTEIITPGRGLIRSYDLDGNLLYKLDGCSPITIATPFSDAGLLYVSSGYVMSPNRPIFAIRPGASGDISLAEGETSNDYIVWCQLKGAPYNPSTLLYKELLYVLYDRGLVATFDSVTGEPVHPQQRISGGRNFTTSPWAANDRVFFLDEFGTTYVYQAGKDFALLHKNKLPSDEMYMATPAMVGDKLLIRSSKRLYCIVNES